MNTNTRLITLSQGQSAIVDAIDYKFLMQWKWCVIKKPTTYGFRWYAVRRTGPLKIYMHRLVAERARLPKSKRYDHRDHNGLNNTRNNLRPCTNAQNLANQRKQFGRSSIYKGVSLGKDRSKWRAYINVGGKRFNLGSYRNETEAHAAYSAAAYRYFGEFAFPWRFRSCHSASWASVIF